MGTTELIRQKKCEEACAAGFHRTLGLGNEENCNKQRFITKCAADLNQWNEGAVTAVTDGGKLSDLSQNRTTPCSIA